MSISIWLVLLEPASMLDNRHSTTCIFGMSPVCFFNGLSIRDSTIMRHTRAVRGRWSKRFVLLRRGGT
jgi:hypothetical protein